MTDFLELIYIYLWLLGDHSLEYPLGMLMHEWALAESIIAAVIDIAQRENAKEVLEIELVIGELQTIDMEIFKFALDEIKKGTIAEKAEIKFVEQKPKFKCNVCGNEWKLENLSQILSEEEIESIHFIPELSHVFIKCPKCGSNDFEIIEGRGIILKGIKVVR